MFNSLKRFFSPVTILLCLIFIFIGFELYSFRGIYMQKFDSAYMYDLYEHSQWTIGKSIRSIGDEGLYQIAGYDLITKENFFKINPEVPPLGKYLYGGSILLFGNPSVISIITFLLSVFVFYLITKLIFDKKVHILLATFLFVIDPMLFSQAKLSMLDLPQLLALLAHIYTILLLTKKTTLSKNIIWIIILAGISLGAFISIKIGFLSLIIIIADFVLLKKDQKKLVIILGISILTYISTYVMYFLQGHSFIEFLKTQKWMLDFYFSSNAKPVIGTVITTLFGGYIKGWSEGTNFWTRVDEWNILWPIYGITFIMVSMQFIKKTLKNFDIYYLFLLTTGFLVAYLVIPFFARYLILILPVLIILFVYVIKDLKFPKILIPIITIVFIIQYTQFLFPPPTETITNIKKQWEASVYQDFYGNFDEKSQANLERYSFWKTMLAFEKDMTVSKKTVTISNPNTYPWENHKAIQIKISYQTLIGTYSHTESANLVRENNIWRLEWKPSLVLPNWNYDSKIESDLIHGKQGELLLTDKTVLSKENTWPVFYVIPEKISDENKLLNELNRLTQINELIIEQYYKANNPISWPARIGFLHPKWPDTYIKGFNLDPGIVIKKEPFREYNFQQIHLGNLNKIRKAEEKYKQILYPQTGGTIWLIDKSGRKYTLLNRKMIDGTDKIITPEELNSQ